jgi:carbamoyl-phosphate synthase small subunit
MADSSVFASPNHASGDGFSVSTVPTAALVLSDGTIFRGQGLGAARQQVGEVCFNTSMTGYQEIISDPSYAGQIITFTFPHIGNVGVNYEDIETSTLAARGVVLRAPITDPANWRAVQSLDAWLKSHNLPGIAGVDTRALTRRIRTLGATTAALIHAPDGNIEEEALLRVAQAWPGLEGMDLAKEVSCQQTYGWNETVWRLGEGYGRLENPKYKIVAVDFGAKRNILRSLAQLGCELTVVPASTPAEDILRHQPDGVFLANGPGDPAATGEYAVPMIQRLLEEKTLPIFGICLGHQLLARALGAETIKMAFGHRGANHPVKDLETGKVEITSQNHGFVVKSESLPDTVEATHVSLFDGTNEGLRLKGRPVFSVQYHPESSPGPQDSHHLFRRFVDLVAQSKAQA